MNDNELMHFGVLGMKWGVRRYQNSDGSLTSAGKKRYSSKDEKREAIATQRLNNRMKKYKKITDKAGYSLYDFDRTRAINTSLKEDLATKSLNDKETLNKIGKNTIKQRRTIVSGTAAISAGAAFVAAVADTTVPLVAIPATTIAAGVAYYRSYH